ncbi:uncharacterized protein ACMZJ9_010109 [Mantella aurantiaca]
MTAKGNALADQAAKEAALMTLEAKPTVGVAQVAGKDSRQQEQWDIETLIQLQNQVPDDERDKWIKCNATKNEQGLWSAEKDTVWPGQTPEYPLVFKRELFSKGDMTWAWFPSWTGWGIEAMKRIDSIKRHLDKIKELQDKARDIAKEGWNPFKGLGGFGDFLYGIGSWIQKIGVYIVMFLFLILFVYFLVRLCLCAITSFTSRRSTLTDDHSIILRQLGEK